MLRSPETGETQDEALKSEIKSIMDGVLDKYSQIKKALEPSTEYKPHRIKKEFTQRIQDAFYHASMGPKEEYGERDLVRFYKDEISRINDRVGKAEKGRDDWTEILKNAKRLDDELLKILYELEDHYIEVGTEIKQATTPSPAEIALGEELERRRAEAESEPEPAPDNQQPGIQPTPPGPQPPTPAAAGGPTTPPTGPTPPSPPTPPSAPIGPTPPQPPAPGVPIPPTGPTPPAPAIPPAGEPTLPTPPTEPTLQTPPPERITIEQRREAGKLSEAIIRAMRQEEKDRIVRNAFERASIFKVIFGGRALRREAETQAESRITTEIRQAVEEYALQKVTGQAANASSKEIFRLMQEYKFDLDDKGRFVPPHDQKQSGLSKFLSRAISPTATTFVGGMVLGKLTRAALVPLIGGLGGAIGGGAFIGGISGWLRGRREARESLFSGDAWEADIDRALNSGNESQIELACHKVERLLTDEKTKNEFFSNRTRLEATMLLNKYREGIRRLALKRMAEDVASRENFEGSMTDYNNFIAEKYTAFNKEFTTQGEERFMGDYQQAYSGALGREVGIVAVGSRAGTQEAGARKAIEQQFNQEAEEKRKERRRIVNNAILKGVLIGGVAGGVGWLIGDLLSGGGGHGGAAVGEVNKPEVIGPPLHESGGQHWGYFTNENTMPEQGNTLAYAQSRGFDELLQNPNMPTTHIDGVLYAGTDQGAAIREAVRTFDTRGVIDWSQVDAKGIDHTHIINLMNFAGSHDAAVSVDTGAGYHLSAEQIQAVVNNVAEKGDAGVLDANAILAGTGMEATRNAVAEGAAEGSKGLWPGWLLIAGGAGVIGSYGTDEARRVRAGKNIEDELNYQRGRTPDDQGPFGANGDDGRTENPNQTPNTEQNTQEREQTGRIGWQEIDTNNAEAIKDALQRLKDQIEREGGRWKVIAKKDTSGRNIDLSQQSARGISEAEVKEIIPQEARILLTVPSANGGTREAGIWIGKDFKNIDHFEKINT